MKFNKKGREKIGEFLCDFQRCLVGSYAKVIAPLKFEPDDFEDCVVLTREEARVIVHALWVLEQEIELEDEERKVKDKLEKIIIAAATKMEKKYEAQQKRTNQTQ